MKRWSHDFDAKDWADFKTILQKMPEQVPRLLDREIMAQMLGGPARGITPFHRSDEVGSYSRLQVFALAALRSPKDEDAKVDQALETDKRRLEQMTPEELDEFDIDFGGFAPTDEEADANDGEWID